MPSLASLKQRSRTLFEPLLVAVSHPSAAVRRSEKPASGSAVPKTFPILDPNDVRE